MKLIKNFYTISLIICTLLLTSCIDMNQYPLDAVSPENYFNNENELELYTNSFYDMLPSAEGVYAEGVDNIIKVTLDAELQGGSRRIVPASGGGWDWGDLRNINFYLQNSVKCKDINARNRYDAVARFFRAYFYYNKVVRFGDVPWYSTTISDKDWDKMRLPRTPRTEVMDSIMADLDFATNFLPDSKSVNEITKWTALAFKSRVCLFEGTFRKYHTELNLPEGDTYLNLAIESAKKVMDSGLYSIYNTGHPESDYTNLFSSDVPNSNEYILARSFSDALQVYNNLNYYTMAASYGRPGLEKRLVNSYLMKDGTPFTDQKDYDKEQFFEETQNRDYRLAQTIRTPGYTRIGEKAVLPPTFGSTVTGYQISKFVMGTKYDVFERSIVAIPIIRYAEILLNYAEAKAELGTLTQEDIDKSIKLIRDRAGLPDLNLVQANSKPDPYQSSLYPNVTGSNRGVILEIRRERRIELVMEGFRWNDILRWKAGSTLVPQFKGMYFPGLGIYDLDHDGKNDVCLYQNEKPDVGKDIQYLKVGSDIVLENGTSGNIVVNPQLKKEWDETRDYFYPIPINERSLNHNLKQNPGWNDGLDF